MFHGQKLARKKGSFPEFVLWNKKTSRKKQRQRDAKEVPCRYVQRPGLRPDVSIVDVTHSRSRRASRGSACPDRHSPCDYRSCLGCSRPWTGPSPSGCPRRQNSDRATVGEQAIDGNDERNDIVEEIARLNAETKSKQVHRTPTKEVCALEGAPGGPECRGCSARRRGGSGARNPDCVQCPRR